MRSTIALLALALSPSTFVEATPCYRRPAPNKEQWANTRYADLLEATQPFKAKGGYISAARTSTVQKVPMFFWLDSFAVVEDMKKRLEEAARHQLKTRIEVLFPFVIYNRPDRDSSGRVPRVASRSTAARQPDLRARHRLDCAVVAEPDSLGNSVTNRSEPNFWAPACVAWHIRSRGWASLERRCPLELARMAGQYAKLME